MKAIIIICLISCSCYKKVHTIVAEAPCDPSKFSDGWQVEFTEGYPVAYKNTCNGTIYMHKQRTGSLFSVK